MNVFPQQSGAFSTTDPALQQHFHAHKQTHVLSYVARVAEMRTPSKWAARSTCMVFTADFERRFSVPGRDPLNSPPQQVELTQHQICKVNPRKGKKKPTPGFVVQRSHHRTCKYAPTLLRRFRFKRTKLLPLSFEYNHISL